jgi:hypothetical protein
VWLLYGIQPHGVRHSMTPGRCKGKAHKPDHLGIAGRRVLVSRKWSNKPRVIFCACRVSGFAYGSFAITLSC